MGNPSRSDAVNAVGPSTSAAVNGTFPAMGAKAWSQMNQRRAELIHKKNRQGLSPEEQLEYESLQERSRRALEQAFPRPPVDEERLDDLEARLSAESEG